MPAVLWSFIVFVHNRYSPTRAGKDGTTVSTILFGTSCWHLTAYSVGQLFRPLDQVLLTISRYPHPAVAVAPRQDQDALRPEGIGHHWAVLYCVIPKVFIATWFIFERFDVRSRLCRCRAP